tara:strand:- start:93 stop:446 length:354 start_codon:yes stop_codon:yes gene_type:complete
MVKKSRQNKIGAWAFLIGVVIAVTLGVFNAQVTAATQVMVLWTLVILGILIGILNITNKESKNFLLVSLTLVIVSYFGKTALIIIPTLGNVLGALLVLFIPTTIIVALKLVFEMAKN